MNTNLKSNLDKVFSKADLIKSFGIKNCIVEKMVIPCFVDMEKVPTIDNNYVFNEDVLNQVLLFLADNYNDCLFLSGESGCGKTSIILQIASRLGYAVEQITCSNKTEVQDLIGHQIIKKGTLFYEYGALTKAMLNGEILLINELDMMSAGELAGLNDLLEGKPLTIVQNNGEIIKPHPNFRVIATGNTKGNGDNSGLYLGARVLNKAFLDRFRFIECDYPSEKIEKKIIKKACPRLSEQDLNNFIKLATDIRTANKKDDDSMDHELSYPFTTRTLLRIAKIFENVESYSIYDAVKLGFSSRLPKIESNYVEKVVTNIFGHEHDKTLNDKHEVVNKVLEKEEEEKRA